MRKSCGNCTLFDAGRKGMGTCPRMPERHHYSTVPDCGDWTCNDPVGEIRDDKVAKLEQALAAEALKMARGG